MSLRNGEMPHVASISTKRWAAQSAAIPGSPAVKQEPSCLKPQATIIQRHSSRRILNINVILAVLKRFDFKKIAVVQFENMTIPEQVETVKNSVVLIGSFGAGLAWSGALHPKAALVEVLWEDLPPRYIYSCKITQKSYGACDRSRYGVRAGYVYVQPQDTISNPKLSGGRASKRKDVRVSGRLLAQLLGRLFPRTQGAGRGGRGPTSRINDICDDPPGRKPKPRPSLDQPETRPARTICGRGPCTSRWAFQPVMNDRGRARHGLSSERRED